MLKYVARIQLRAIMKGCLMSVTLVSLASAGAAVTYLTFCPGALASLVHGMLLFDPLGAQFRTMVLIAGFPIMVAAGFVTASNVTRSKFLNAAIVGCINEIPNLWDSSLYYSLAGAAVVFIGVFLGAMLTND